MSKEMGIDSLGEASSFCEFLDHLKRGRVSHHPTLVSASQANPERSVGIPSERMVANPRRQCRDRRNYSDPPASGLALDQELSPKLVERDASHCQRENLSYSARRIKQ